MFLYVYYVAFWVCFDGKLHLKGRDRKEREKRKHHDA